MTMLGVTGAMLAIGLQAAATPAPTRAPSAPPPPVAAPPAPRSLPPGLSRTVRPINPGEWIQQSDYPIGALANNQSGMVGFRVQVGPEGLVTNCLVTRSSGWPLLDEYTCRLISERARFTAALDTRGRPTAGSYSNRIQWRIPVEPPPVATPAPTSAPAPAPPR
jgi:periplasmic protein TonB